MPIRGFPVQGVVACFTEPNAIGSIDDFNASRNGPVKSPALHLDKITFHSSFYQYEVAAGPVDVPVSHSGLAYKQEYIGIDPSSTGIISNPFTPPSIAMLVVGDVRTTDILLFTHGLGYVPKFMVSYAGRRLPDGYLIQVDAGATAYRRVAVWANASGIYLRETAVSGNGALSAASFTYRVIVFKESVPVSGQPLFGKVGSALVLARGIINSAKSYLRRTGSGDTPFALNLGRTIDVSNGSSRTIIGGVVVSEPGYNGSFAAPPFVSVGVN